MRMLINTEPVVGRVYQFNYDSVNRKVVCRESKDGFLNGYDFTREDFRRFKQSKIMEAIDITDDCIIMPADDEKIAFFESKGIKVYDDGENSWVLLS